MGIVSAPWHTGKHASWLTGYVCLAWGQHTVRVGGWDCPVRSGDWGSHPGCAISCLCHIGRPQTLQLKPRGLKTEEPRVRSVQAFVFPSCVIFKILTLDPSTGS